MRLASFLVQGRETWGAVQEDVVLDATAVLGARFADLRSAIASNAYRELLQALPSLPRHPITAVTWLPVIPNPGKILCIGLNYADHRRETGHVPVPFPTVFARFSNSQTGHLQGIPLSPLSRELDYEGELAVVIARSGRYIPRKDAPAYIAGYACYNDFTLRDWQRHSLQFTPSKNFPSTGAFGPWLVTADEIASLQSLRLLTRVNGAVVQSATFSQMIFDVPSLIEYCSNFTRLEPGDVIVTGTPGGVGARRQPPSWLKPGDITEVEIEGIGLLRNPIINEGDA